MNVRAISFFDPIKMMNRRTATKAASMVSKSSKPSVQQTTAIGRFLDKITLKSLTQFDFSDYGKAVDKCNY